MPVRQMEDIRSPFRIRHSHSLLNCDCYDVMKLMSTAITHDDFGKSVSILVKLLVHWCSYSAGGVMTFICSVADGMV